MKKYKKTCKNLNIVENWLILVSTVTGCVLIFAFASLVRVPVGITSSVIELKICATTSGIKMCKSSILKRKEKIN